MSTTQGDAGYEAALAEAHRGLDEGGIPIGAALARGDEIDYGDLTLYTTLSPCALCTGAILLFKVRHVVIGEADTFCDERALASLRDSGVRVEVLDDPRARSLMQRFIAARPEVWAEDIGS